MYSVFGCPGTLLRIIIIIIIFFFFTNTVSCMVAPNRVTVSYGSCVIAASDLYSTVSYGRAVRTQSAVDDVRDVPSMMYVLGVVVLTRYALPFVRCCTIYHLLCVSIYEKTHLLWNIKIRS